MGFFKQDEQVVKVDELTNDLFQGGNFISKSGVYDLKILAIQCFINENNARSLNLLVQMGSGTPFVLWAVRLDNNNGERNFQYEIFEDLRVFANLQKSIREPVEVSTNTGIYKDFADQIEKATKRPRLDKLLVLQEFEGIEIKARVQMQYNFHENEIKEKRVITHVFDKNGASAFEIVNNTEKGEKLEKVLKFAEENYYQGISEQQVAKWKESKKGNSSSSSDSSSDSDDADYNGEDDLPF